MPHSTVLHSTEPRRCCIAVSAIALCSLFWRRSKLARRAQGKARMRSACTRTTISIGRVAPAPRRSSSAALHCAHRSQEDLPQYPLTRAKPRLAALAPPPPNPSLHMSASWRYHQKEPSTCMHAQPTFGETLTLPLASALLGWHVESVRDALRRSACPLCFAWAGWLVALSALRHL